MGTMLLAALLVAASASADPVRTEGVAPPVPFRTRLDIGLSAGIAYPRCDGCWKERWGPAFGGYAIVRPWPGFGFGVIYERATFGYRVDAAAADGSQWLLTPVMRGMPLRTTWLELWIDAGAGFGGAETRFENGAGESGNLLGATVATGLMVRAGSRLRIGPYARATAVGVGRKGPACDDMFPPRCGPALPAHVGAYTLGLTVGIVHPGEVE